MNSKALTKIQAVLLVAIIVVAVGAGAAYVLLSGQKQSSDAIKIGICADLDKNLGHAILQAAVLAAEQVNAEGGVLGRNLTIVREDNDVETVIDVSIARNAFEKLILVDEADFLVTHVGGDILAIYQGIVAEKKKILLSLFNPNDELSQKVLDDYGTYKYFFSVVRNSTNVFKGMVDTLVCCRELTGFNKVALMSHTGTNTSLIIDSLCDKGFDVVLDEEISFSVTDFSSYFAKAEAAGAEIVHPLLYANGVPFVNEYYDRQSPMVMWGLVFYANVDDFWELTDGRCKHITIMGFPAVAGYNFTSKTLAIRDAYLERWGEPITNIAAVAYDTVRFILVDAIERAGTIETDAVIEALEETDVETSSNWHFIFTASHDVLSKEIDANTPLEDYTDIICMFQWQDGVQVPVYPLAFMSYAEANFTYPEWEGPWD